MCRRARRYYTGEVQLCDTNIEYIPEVTEDSPDYNWLSQPELEGNRIVLNATKQAPAPQASNFFGRASILGRASQPKEAWK
jgi:hypothetical protein